MIQLASVKLKISYLYQWKAVVVAEGVPRCANTRHRIEIAIAARDASLSHACMKELGAHGPWKTPAHGILPDQARLLRLLFLGCPDQGEAVRREAHLPRAHEA